MVQKNSLLRFVTCGSVDDGKSTLIGRLLYETDSIFEDQYQSIESASKKKGFEKVDLSLIADGLKAEREQLITIDVAYKYFSIENKKFIIADSPGHEQYTRNMITGASNSDCAVILIDASKGVQTQSRRHGFIASLLRIPHVVVVVNKMDMVNYSETIYRQIIDDYILFSEKLQIHDMQFIPVSALIGDNVVEKSENMPWFRGITLLQYLQNIHTSSDRNLIDFRFPVQFVIRPDSSFRGYAGRVASGTIVQGEEITVLPSRKRSRIKSIVTYDGKQDECFLGQSVTLELEDDIDISRGDMIIRSHNIPNVSNRFDATICWMDAENMELNKQYALKHTTRMVKGYVYKLCYKIDINSLHRHNANTFKLNEIGRVEIKTSSPLYFDPYQINRTTGAFILIDPLTNNTVAAGMIRNKSKSDTSEKLSDNTSSNTYSTGWNIPRESREQRNGHGAAVLWMTGLSGAGKSTIANALEEKLFDLNFHTVVLDGDNMRCGLCGDLGFSQRDRSENIRRAAETAKLFYETGNLVICTFISPQRMQRAFARNLIDKDRFFEIYIRCSLEECKRRDPKGLYLKAVKGEIEEFTGISSPYEEPENPEMVIDTTNETMPNQIKSILDFLKNRIRFPLLDR